LIPDILKEAARAKKLLCTYCHKRNANLGCCVESCPKSYHIDCGLKRNVSLEFTGSFPSFCSKHARFKQIEKPKCKDSCRICWMKDWSNNKPIRIPCCKSWFHRSCLQKYSFYAGVKFKCPLCNNTEKCLEMLPKLGIFMPEKDDDYALDVLDELELIEVPCDSNQCQNSGEGSLYLSWKMCSICGYSRIHENCCETSEFVCQSCAEILNTLKNVTLTPQNNHCEDRPSAESPPVKEKLNPLFSDEEEVSDNEKENSKLHTTPPRAIKRKRGNHGKI
jgi:G2/M phase-specific E3 ubiquitin-protein ligase